MGPRGNWGVTKIVITLSPEITNHIFTQHDQSSCTREVRSVKTKHWTCEENHCDFYPFPDLYLPLVVNPNQYSTLLYSTLDWYLQFLCIYGRQVGRSNPTIIESQSLFTAFSWYLSTSPLAISATFYHQYQSWNRPLFWQHGTQFVIIGCELSFHGRDSVVDLSLIFFSNIISLKMRNTHPHSLLKWQNNDLSSPPTKSKMAGLQCTIFISIHICNVCIVPSIMCLRMQLIKPSRLFVSFLLTSSSLLLSRSRLTEPELVKKCKAEMGFLAQRLHLTS